MTHREKIRAWETALGLWRATRDSSKRGEFRRIRRELNRVLKRLGKTLDK